MEEEYVATAYADPTGAWLPIPDARSFDSEKLMELTYKDRKFIFHREMPVRVTQDEDGWTIESDEYGLMGYGDSRSDAEMIFGFDFTLRWDEIACEDDGKLARDAREMKRKLLGLVKEVL